MRRTSISLAVAGLLAGAGAAHAASGTVTDRRGDFPDIIELRYGSASPAAACA